MKKYIAVAVLLTVAGLGFRLFLALHLPTDEPNDGRLYARIAINVLEHRGYSIETEEPYSPTTPRARSLMTTPRRATRRSSARNRTASGGSR